MPGSNKNIYHIIDERLLTEGLGGSPLKINELLQPLTGSGFKIYPPRVKKRSVFKEKLTLVKTDLNITTAKALLGLTILYLPVFGSMIVLNFVDMPSVFGIVALSFYAVLMATVIIWNSGRKDPKPLCKNPNQSLLN